ncbi:MAG: hypothetical protein AAF411_26880 [Myxococcota bacterium]
MRYFVALTLAVSLGPTFVGTAQTASDQRVLGPGAYVYQTRLDTASCEEASQSGYTSTFFAAVDGVPGDRDMRMTLLNSQFWPTWQLAVQANGHIMGDATIRNGRGPNPARSHFEVERRGDHFRGRGYREYNATVNGQRRRCRNDFDVLIRRLDLARE